MLDEPWTNHLPTADNAQADPTALLSTLPYQLGFLPAPGQAVLSCWTAGGFPTAEVADLDADAEKILAGHARRFRRANAAPAFALTVVAEDHDGTTFSADVLDRLVAALRQVKANPVVACRVASITEGAAWTSVTGGSGVVSDPRKTRVALAADVHGYTFHASEESVAAIVAPDPNEVLQRRAEALAQLHWAEGLTMITPAAGEPSPSRRRHDLVMRHLKAAFDPTPPLGEGEIVVLAAALADWRVRDYLFLHVDDVDLRNAGARLFAELTRRCPTSVVADAACLLAWYSLWRGDRAVMLRALARAKDAVSGHKLAALLSTDTQSITDLASFNRVFDDVRDRVNLDHWPVVVGVLHDDH